MDTGENIERRAFSQSYYKQLKEISDTFNEGVAQLLTIHYNHLVDKYGNYKRYPRKVKKYLKKMYWYEIVKRGKKLNPGDLKVTNKLCPEQNEKLKENKELKELREDLKKEVFL